MMINRYLFLVAFLAAVLALPVLVVAGNVPEGLKTGTAAPNIFGRRLDDSPFSLSRERAGPKVIAFFWVRCAPCRKELPEMAAMEKKYPSVQFIAVHADAALSKELPTFLREIGSHPSSVVIADSTIATRYSFKSFPHTVVLDEKNVVRLVLGGYDRENMDRLETFVKQMKNSEGRP